MKKHCSIIKIMIAFTLLVFLYPSGNLYAEYDSLVLWNKLGSETEIANSEVGPGFQLTSYIYSNWQEAQIVPAKFGGGLFINHDTNEGWTGDGGNFFATNVNVMGLTPFQGCIEFWFLFKYDSSVHNNAEFFGTRNALTGHFPNTSIVTNVVMAAEWNGWDYGSYGKRFNFTIGPVYITTPDYSAAPGGNLEFSDGTMFHFAFVWDLNGIDDTVDKMRIYVNGKIEASGTEQWPTTGGLDPYLYLGSPPNYYSYDHYYNAVKGVHDNIKIWDYAKTDFSDRFDEDPYMDGDSDGIADDSDNCVDDPNPEQSNIDTDDFGDICDMCPADALDQCDPDGSTAEEIPADQGGTVKTPDEALTICIEPGNLAEDTTISVTQTIPQDPEVDLTIGPNRGLGKAIAVYDLQPDGLQFSHPVTLTIVVDVTELNANQRKRLNLYLYDEVIEAFVTIPGTASNVVEGPSGTFTATLTTEVYHFSTFAVVAPLDSDNDGVPDLFDDLIDLCSAGLMVVNGFMPPLAPLMPESEEPPLLPKSFKQGRTLPLRLQLLCGSVAYGDSDVSPPEISEITRTGEVIILEIIDPDAGQANDDSIFRYSEEDIWVYNLKTTNLTSGTYDIDIKTPEGQNLKAGFVLR